MKYIYFFENDFIVNFFGFRKEYTFDSYSDKNALNKAIEFIKERNLYTRLYFKSSIDRGEHSIFFIDAKNKSECLEKILKAKDRDKVFITMLLVEHYDNFKKFINLLPKNKENFLNLLYEKIIDDNKTLTKRQSKQINEIIKSDVFKKVLYKNLKEKSAVKYLQDIINEWF